MNVSVLLALSPIILAGIINGSFALPTKHVKQWRFENIWLAYSFWAFLIVPCLVALFLSTHAFSVYASVPYYSLSVMVIFGVLFGIGQVCFALALNSIGLSLGFLIVIGLSTALGFFMPLLVQHPQELITHFGLAVTLATVLIIIGLLLSYYAGRKRDVQQSRSDDTQKQVGAYWVGVLLAVVAGLCSAGQNFAFSMTTNMQVVALHLGMSDLSAATVMWPGFLACTFVPYALYMIFLLYKHQSFHMYQAPNSWKYHCYAVVMGIFWYGSLIFYSKASQMIGTLGPIVGWPLFMVLIILTSSFWGWKSGEWQGCSLVVKKMSVWAISCLILAVLILAFASTLAKV